MRGTAIVRTSLANTPASLSKPYRAKDCSPPLSTLSAMVAPIAALIRAIPRFPLKPCWKFMAKAITAP